MAWFGAWSGVLASALTPPQGHFTTGQAGLLGALVTFAGVCVCTCACTMWSLVKDYRVYRKKWQGGVSWFTERG